MSPQERREVLTSPSGVPLRSLSLTSVIASLRSLPGVAVLPSLGLATTLLVTATPARDVECTLTGRSGVVKPGAVTRNALGCGVARIAGSHTVTQTVDEPQGGWSGEESQHNQQEPSGWSGGTSQVPEPSPSPASQSGFPVDTGALPDWPLLVWDDFSDPATGWYLGSPDEPQQGTYEDGALRIAFDGQATDRREVFSVHQFRDLRVDVDVQVIGAAEDVFYGLFVRFAGSYGDESHYYSFRIGTDGTYRILLQSGASQVRLQDETQSSCLLTGPDAVNHLTVVAQGPAMDFYANGCLLTSSTDPTVGEGDIGLVAGRLSSAGPVDVRFDNFRVYSLESLRSAVFGTVANSLASEDSLAAQGEFWGLWPFPAESTSTFPSGTKRVFVYVPFEGMTPTRRFAEVALIDGVERLRSDVVPWAHYVRSKGKLGCGVYGTIYSMTQGGDLPTGHWEVRFYVDDVLVARTFFSIGTDVVPVPPEPLQIGSGPAIGALTLPPPQELLAQAESLCGQHRCDQGLAYGQLAIAAAPNSEAVLEKVASLYSQAGMQEWTQMLQWTAENLAVGRSDVAG